ncbi:MAG: Inosine-5'-monophosphate dehydrogenase [Candidatus Heimdallarchaeota archaeon LC_2]|nr:MAG: Inosine-5'-monophosphate dehydrogenase [Candidatus Heimdallarchaeota archaeon LC_2]
MELIIGGILITQKTIIEIATTVDAGIVEGAPNRTLESAILIMGRKKFRRLPITKLGKIRGILTVTDIIRAISEKGLPEAFDETISDWMTDTPRTILSSTTVIEASKIMSKENFGSLLIVEPEDPEMLSGIVTERDILRLYRNDDWENLKLSDIPKDLLTKGLVKVNYKETLQNAIKLMYTHHTRRVLNVDDTGKLIGILSANDITTLCSKEREEINENPNFLKSLTTHFVGSKDILTTTMDISLKEAVEIMCENNIGSLPILENNDIIGLISERTIVHIIAKQ